MMHTPLCDCCCCIQWLLFRFCGSLFDFFCVMRVLSVLIQYGKLTYNISLHLMHRVLLSWYTIICVLFDSRRFYRIFFIICYPNYSVALVASIKKSGMVCTVVAIPCDLKLNWINILLVGHALLIYQLNSSNTGGGLRNVAGRTIASISS